VLFAVIEPKYGERSRKCCHGFGLELRDRESLLRRILYSLRNGKNDNENVGGEPREKKMKVCRGGLG
jgi:hypothetical protein